ncbi:hypothetical protein [Mollivirus kamchatka]|nr:hypothetical protein [Mollivirus kamchatka]
MTSNEGPNKVAEALATLHDVLQDELKDYGRDIRRKRLDDLHSATSHLHICELFARRGNMKCAVYTLMKHQLHRDFLVGLTRKADKARMGRAYDDLVEVLAANNYFCNDKD